MLQRYTKLREYLRALESCEIDELTLSCREGGRVDDLLSQIAPFGSVSRALQKNSTSVSHSRALLDPINE